VRRATRSGTAEGVAIEDLGISGHETYTMTKRDLTEDNVGLLNFCGALLRAQPYTNMTVTRDEDEPSRLTVVTTGLDRLDVVVDGRPRESRNVADRATTIVDVDGPWERVDLSGYADDELRQRRRVLA
jgi:hypothetical protein